MNAKTFKPPLLLLSGLLCDEEIWADLLPQLPDVCTAGVIAFPDLSSIGAMADRVLSSAPPTFALAGHSMGGRVALEVYRRAPTRVLGIALLNTGIHSTREQEWTTRGRLVEIARTQGLSALAAEWLPPMLAADRPVDDPLRLRLVRMVERNSPESFAAQIQALLDRPESESVLASIRVPALLVSATEDSWSTPAQHAGMQAILPRATLAIIHGAGHMCPAEKPVEVALAIRGWLSRVSEATVSPLPPQESLVIRAACTELIHRYARLNDLGAWDALCALFSEDAALYRPATPDTAVKGKANILQSFRGRPPRATRHVVSNVEIFVDSPQRAFATSSVILHVGEQPGSDALASISVGRFRDEIRLLEGEWLFAERRGRIELKAVVTTSQQEKA